MTLREAETLRKLPGIDSVVRRINKINLRFFFFPNKIPFDWNEDNFGPIVIPKKGMTVELNRKNLSLFKNYW